MNHEKIKKKLLLYIDGDLPESEMSLMREHINICPDCKETLRKLSGVWNMDNNIEHIAPSPYLWTKLESKINNLEQNENYSLKELTRSFLRPVLIGVIFFMIIALGYMQGNSISNSTDINMDSVYKEKIADIFYLDKLDRFSSEYMTVAYNENLE